LLEVINFFKSEYQTTTTTTPTTTTTTKNKIKFKKMERKKTLLPMGVEPLRCQTAGMIRENANFS